MSSVSQKSLGGNRFFVFAREYFLVLVVILLVIVFALINARFFTSANMSNLLRQASANVIISIGMLAVVLTGGIDLSVGMMAGLSGVLVAGFIHGGMPAGAAAPLVLCIGIGIGLAMGFLVVYMGLAPYIATMSTMLIVTGIKLLYSHSLSIPISMSERGFLMIGRGSLFGVPIPIYIMLALVIIFQFVMSMTTYGRSLYALGGNPEAASLAGINVKLMTMSVYMISGFCSFAAGIMLASRLASGSPSTGTGFDTNAIASVVIGGGSLAGGRGKPILMLFGALVIAMLSNFLNLMGVQNYVQRIITGCIIILSVFVSERTNHKKR